MVKRSQFNYFLDSVNKTCFLTTGSNLIIEIFSAFLEFLLALSTFFAPQIKAQIDCPLGQLDTSFDPGVGANAYVYRAITQPDGKIIICGDFTAYVGTTRNYIARLNNDGTLGDLETQVKDILKDIV